MHSPLKQCHQCATVRHSTQYCSACSIYKYAWPATTSACQSGTLASSMRIDTCMLCSTSSSPRQSVAAADAHLARCSAHSSAEGLGGSSTSSMTWITVCGGSSSSSMAGRKSPTNAWGSMCFPAYRVAACGHQQASNGRQSRQMPRVAVACSLESLMRGALVTSWQF